MRHESNVVRISQHANARCRQRGLTLAAVALVMEFGEGVDDGYLMTAKVMRSACKALSIQRRRKDIQKLDHLRDVAVIDVDDTILTVYRADKKRIRRLRAGHIQTKADRPGKSQGETS